MNQKSGMVVLLSFFLIGLGLLRRVRDQIVCLQPVILGARRSPGASKDEQPGPSVLRGSLRSHLRMTDCIFSLVPEVAHPGEHHGEPRFIRCVDHFVVIIEPPGWITAVAPASATISNPSGKGEGFPTPPLSPPSRRSGLRRWPRPSP